MAKNTSRRGASRGGSKKQSRQVPGWVWLFTGAIAGLFVAFLVHLAHVQMEQGRASGGDRNVAEKPPAKEKDEDNTAKDDQPKFDFYAVLPKMEVIVPKGEGDEQTTSRGSSSETSGGDKTADKPVAGRHDKRFLLQAGSFRNEKDADRRRAELILKGYQARIQPVDMDNGDTWHRVMIGPYDNINTLHRAQDKLAANGVETLPIQLKE
jgi:cell division protein FtsN